MKEKTRRRDQAEWLRRTFDFDVLACVRYGGRRRVLAYVRLLGAALLGRGEVLRFADILRLDQRTLASANWRDVRSLLANLLP